MKRLKRFPAGYWLWLTAAWLPAAPAFTQTTDAGFGDIVVTAQKREQGIQDVGIAITAVSGDTISALGLVSTNDLQAIVPALKVTDFGTSATVAIISIRGVSQNDFTDHNEAPNAVYLDGAYISFAGAVGTQMYDMERVEVLRGPQGTLFGRNATGGVLQLVTRKPSDRFEAQASLSFAEYNHVRFEGAVGIPVSETLSTRIAVATNHKDGYFRNRIAKDSGQDASYNGRLQLLWKPSPDLKILFNLRASTVDDVSAGGYDIRPVFSNPANDGLIEYVPPGAANPTCPLLFGIDAPPGQTDCFGFTEPDDDPLTGSFDRGSFSRDYIGATATIEWSGGGFDFTSITDWQSLDKHYFEDSDSTPLPVGHSVTGQDSYQLSQEFRLSGQSDRFTWVLGAYGLIIDGDYLIGIDSVLFDAFIRNRYSLRTTTQALFAQGEYKLTPQLTLIAGARYNWDRKRFSFDPACAGAGCVFFEAPGTVQVEGFRGRRKTGDYSYKVELDWRPSADLLLYAGVTRGNKAGSYAAPLIGRQTREQMPYDSEVLTNYEGGLKLTLPDMRGRLNASIFYYDYDGYQDYDIVNLSQIITNQKAKLYGSEIEFYSNPATGLDINLSVAYLRGRVSDRTLPSGRKVDQDMPYSPSWRLTGLVRQEWDVGFAFLSVQADAAYSSAFYHRSTNHPTYREGAYTIVNARVALASSDRKWELAAFGKNIGDTRYRLWTFEDTTLNGVQNRGFGAPSTYGVSLSFKY